MEKSRTNNSIRNAKSALVKQLLNKLLAFIVRSFFIQVLSTEYLGVNGLFTNILTVLSFAELGIGTAIIFNMYKPVAENDVEMIKSLIQLYKKSYIIIGCAVFLIGILVIPFLPWLVKDVPTIKENITFIYFLFLINTTISYFFSYKKSIISAYQQESVINQVYSVTNVIKSIIEIIFLLVTKNYVIYLLFEIVNTIVQNIIISNQADRYFPYLNDKDVKPLDNSEISKIIKNVKSLVVYKIGGIILNGTDNIIMSIMLNVTTVGLCSNYSLIINSVKSVITAVQESITSSIGNLNAIDSVEKKENIFYQLYFMNFWIYAVASILFISLLDPFVEIWLGRDYVLGMAVSIALTVSFFIEGLRITPYMYRVTLGLFEKGKITPYISIVVNVISSILFCKLFGVVGIFIGTSLAQLCSYSWIDPLIIHKYEFKTPLRKYFHKFFKYTFTFIWLVIFTYYINSKITGNIFISFMIKMIISLILPNIILILFYYKTEEFRELRSRLLAILRRKNTIYKMR